MLRAAARVLAALVMAAAPAGAAELRGQVRVELPGVHLEDVGPVVVYLERVAASPTVKRAAPQPVLVRQRDARFSPPFVAVGPGQEVAMPNDDGIYHNVFSVSVPNDFDLGLYPAGHSRSVRFVHPGAVRIYCAIHESMNGTIFVAPTPFFAVPDAGGGFVIGDVPEGDWRLRTWAERLPATARPLRLGPGATRVDLDLAEGGS